MRFIDDNTLLLTFLASNNNISQPYIPDTPTANLKSTDTLILRHRRPATNEHRKAQIRKSVAHIMHNVIGRKRLRLLGVHADDDDLVAG
jgi:hypothetical protein